MGIQLTEFDISEYLKDEKSIAEYLSAVVEEGDVKLLLAALSDVAKARGMSKIASDTGLGRESLYKALNAEAKPRFETILKVLKSLGLTIGFNPVTTNKTSVKRMRPLPINNKVKVLPIRKIDAKVKSAGRKKK